MFELAWKTLVRYFNSEELFHVAVVMFTFSTIAGTFWYYKNQLLPPEVRINHKPEDETSVTKTTEEDIDLKHISRQMNDRDGDVDYTNCVGRKSIKLVSIKFDDDLVEEEEEEEEEELTVTEHKNEASSLMTDLDEGRNISPTASLLDLITDYSFESISHSENRNTSFLKSILSVPLPVVIEADESCIEDEYSGTLNIKLFEESSIIPRTNEFNMINECRSFDTFHEKVEKNVSCINEETIEPSQVQEIESGNKADIAFYEMNASDETFRKSLFCENTNDIFTNEKVCKIVKNIDPENQKEYKERKNDENKIKDEIQRKYGQLIKSDEIGISVEEVDDKRFYYRISSEIKLGEESLDKLNLFNTIDESEEKKEEEEEKEKKGKIFREAIEKKVKTGKHNEPVDDFNFFHSVIEKRKHREVGQVAGKEEEEEEEEEEEQKESLDELKSSLSFAKENKMTVKHEKTIARENYKKNKEDKLVGNAHFDENEVAVKIEEQQRKVVQKDGDAKSVLETSSNGFHLPAFLKTEDDLLLPKHNMLTAINYVTKIDDSQFGDEKSGLKYLENGCNTSVQSVKEGHRSLYVVDDDVNSMEGMLKMNSNHKEVMKRKNVRIKEQSTPCEENCLESTIRDRETSLKRTDNCIDYQEIISKEFNVCQLKTIDSDENQFVEKSKNLCQSNSNKLIRKTLLSNINSKTQSNGTEFYFLQSLHRGDKSTSVYETTQEQVNKDYLAEDIKNLNEYIHDLTSAEEKKFRNIKNIEAERAKDVRCNLSNKTENFHHNEADDIVNTTSGGNSIESVKKKRDFRRITYRNFKSMGQLLALIFETDNFEDVPIEAVDMLGGKITISEDGEYAVIDVEGQRKEYKIDRKKLRNSQDFSEKIRSSRDLAALFIKLENLDVVGKNTDPENVLNKDKKLVDLQKLADHYNNKIKESSLVFDTIVGNENHSEENSNGASSDTRTSSDRGACKESDKSSNSERLSKINSMKKDDNEPQNESRKSSNQFHPLKKISETLYTKSSHEESLEDISTRKMAEEKNLSSISGLNMILNNNEPQLSVNETNIIIVNKHNTYGVSTDHKKNLNENKSCYDNEDIAKHIININSNLKDHKVKNDVVSDDQGARQSINENESVCSCSPVDVEELSENKSESLKGFDFHELDKNISQSVDVLDKELDLSEQKLNDSKKTIANRHLHDVSSSREVGVPKVTRENAFVQDNQVSFSNTINSFNSSGNKLRTNNNTANDREIKNSSTEEENCGRFEKESCSSFGETLTKKKTNVHVDFVTDKTTSVKDKGRLVIEKRSKSLGSLPTQLMQTNEIIVGDASSPTMMNRKLSTKCYSMEIRRKKPRVVLSANFDSCPKIKETNLDDLIKSMCGQGSPSYDYILSMPKQKDVETRNDTTILSDIKDSYCQSLNLLLAKETDIDDASETDLDCSEPPKQDTRNNAESVEDRDWDTFVQKRKDSESLCPVSPVNLELQFSPHFDDASLSSCTEEDLSWAAVFTEKEATQEDSGKEEKFHNGNHSNKNEVSSGEDKKHAVYPSNSNQSEAVKTIFVPEDGYIDSTPSQQGKQSEEFNEPDVKSIVANVLHAYLPAIEMNTSNFDTLESVPLLSSSEESLVDTRDRAELNDGDTDNETSNTDFVTSNTDFETSNLDTFAQDQTDFETGAIKSELACLKLTEQLSIKKIQKETEMIINDGEGSSKKLKNEKSVTEEVLEEVKILQVNHVNDFLSVDPLDSSISTISPDASTDIEFEKDFELTFVTEANDECVNDEISDTIDDHHITVVIQNEDETTSDNKRHLPFTQPLDVLDKTDSDVKNAILSENVDTTSMLTLTLNDNNESNVITDDTDEFLFAFETGILTSSPRDDNNGNSVERKTNQEDFIAPPVSIDENELNSTDTSYSFVEAEIEPVTETVKTAAISHILTPRDSEIKSAPNTPFTVKKAQTDEYSKLIKSNSCHFPTDYELSRNSQLLIDTIEMDIENEFDEGSNFFKEIPDKHTENIKLAKNNLKRVASRKLYNGSCSENNVGTFKPISSPAPLNTNFSHTKRCPSESSLEIHTSPYGLNLKPYNANPRMSSSLHNIFTGDDLETDIDEVDEMELLHVLQSPSLRERSPDVKVTDVDKMLSNTTKPQKCVNARKYVIVSRTERRLSEKSIRSPTSPKEVKLDSIIPIIGNGAEVNVGVECVSIMQNMSEDEKEKINHEVKLPVKHESVKYFKGDMYEEISEQDKIVSIHPENIMEPTDKISDTDAEQLRNSIVEVIQAKNVKIAQDDGTASISHESIDKQSENIYNNVVKPPIDLKQSDANYTENDTIVVNNMQHVNTQLIKVNVDENIIKPIKLNQDEECQLLPEIQNKEKLKSKNYRSNRDSWDILEKSPTHQINMMKQSSLIDQGYLTAKTGERDSEKHRSWNILDLKEDDDNLRLFIAQKTNQEAKRNSSDIEYLFEKYQKEKESIKRMNNNNNTESLSDFSDISSMSDTDSVDDDVWYKNVTETEEPELHYVQAMQTHQSAFSPIEYLSDDEIERLRQFQFHTETVSETNSPRLPHNSTHSFQVVTPIALTSPRTSQITTFPTEVKKTVVADLPSPIKAKFVPQFTMFNDDDLSNMVLAQAASAVRKRRRGERKSVQDEPRIDVSIPSELNIDTNRRIEMKASDSGISDSSNNLSPREERSNSFKPVEGMTPTEDIPAVVSLSKQNINKHNAYENGFSLRQSPRHTSNKSIKSSTSTIQSKHSNESEMKRKHTSVNLSGHTINIRNYEASSMPNLSFDKRLSSEDLELFDADEFASEFSLVSDTCFDLGSVVDDELYIYPSLHLRSRSTTPKCRDENSDSSGGESFSTEDHDCFSNLRLKDSERTVYCGNPPCSKQQVMVGHERSMFTSCSSCFTCYCSRACRKAHWQDHKRICFYGRISYYIRSLIRRCEREPQLNAQLYSLAAESYSIFGRGSLMINFDTATDAKIALVSKTTALTTSPIYTSEDNIRNEAVQNRHTRLLYQTLHDYDPEKEFVINISIIIGDTKNSIKNSRKSTVVRCARISILSTTSTIFGPTLSSYAIRTFSLPKTFGEDFITDMEARRYYCREISFGLKRCGVHLKTEYPDAYDKLCSYVEQAVMFLPLVLYGQKNGQNYKCILYPGSINKCEEAYGEGVLV